MKLTSQELELLTLVAPRLGQSFGPIEVYEFTVSFWSQGWVCRVDFAREGDDPATKMKGALFEGQNETIWSCQPVARRIFREFPRLAAYRKGLLEIDLAVEVLDPLVNRDW